MELKLTSSFGSFGILKDGGVQFDRVLSLTGNTNDLNNLLNGLRKVSNKTLRHLSSWLKTIKDIKILCMMQESILIL